MTVLSRHAAFVLVLLVYAALLGVQIDHGLASGDGHGIVRTVQTLLDNGKIEVSRPPGHPTTELYLFGGAGWLLLKTFGIEFTDRIYLIFQALASLGALVVFYRLLLKIGGDRFRSVLAATCLACSTQFLFNALDGEEFNFGVLFLLLSISFLIPAPASFIRLSGSVLCFALATGCRPELIFVAVVFPVYCLFQPSLRWKGVFLIVTLLAVAILIVWAPILLQGVQPPYTAGMRLREAILGGVYRIIFQAFTPIVFLLFVWTLLVSTRNLKKQWLANSFVFAISWILVVIFLAVFFLHPSKAAHLLPAVPFLLILAAGRSVGLLLALGFFSVLSCFIGVDIFKDRQLVRPYLTSGSYFQLASGKPYYKLEYLRKLLSQCENRPAAIIGDAWPWDFEYHVERNNFSAREQDLHGEIKHDLPTFFTEGEHCVFLSPEAAYEPALLKEWQQKGYAMKMDAKLYRTMFARYDVRSNLSTNTAEVSGVPFALFRTD